MESSIRIRNPRTGEVDYEVERMSAQEVADIARHLRKGQVGWAERSPEERVQVLLEWRDVLTARRDDVAQALYRDTGRMNESVLEVDGVIGSIERWSRVAPSWQGERESRGTSVPFLEVGAQDVPMPLVGIISPWNFPLLLSLIDAVPALFMGCAVAFKPSSVTPRFVEPLMETVKAVPELTSVLDCVMGDGRHTGTELIRQVDTVVFTGSTETGRKVGELAAEQLIPVFLELGGKDAVIVLGDADIDRTSAAVSWGGLVNAGQSCLSIERVYVDEAIFEPFVRRLSERAETLEFCSGEDPTQGQIGPIIEESQARLIQRQIDEAVAQGARVECGGKVEDIGGGLWCQPTVLTGVDHGMKVMSEETFGPVLGVMPFATEDEAVSLANDSRYGLSGAVFSASNERALTVARRMEAGAISINDCALTAFIHEGEKQSFKQSGVGGSRMGVASLRRFVRRKALIHNREQIWDPWWFAGN
jgi:acyl-CoA reductase-like NAD-dependent aldehyde dehydrogenase